MKNTPSPMKPFLRVPAAVLAGESSPQPSTPHPLARPNNPTLARTLAKKLKKGEPVVLGSQGQATEQPGGNTITIPKGTLAGEPPAPQPAPHPLARPTNNTLAQTLARKIRNGEPVQLGQSGNAGDTNNGNTVSIPKDCRLAAQWYQENPRLLNVEVETMRRSIFSDFVLMRQSDDTYYWEGDIIPGIMEHGRWHVCALYPQNFPTPTMGGTMRVYLVDPTLEQIEETLGVRLHHLLRDENSDRFLCTAREEDVEHVRRGMSSSAITGAVTSLALATKWLAALELVLTGHMSVELFNSPGGI